MEIGFLVVGGVLLGWWLFNSPVGEQILSTVNPLHVQKDPDLLQPDFKAKIFGFLGDCNTLGKYFGIVETLRSSERQAYLEGLHDGTTYTLHSKHLAHAPDGKARAADILPVDFVDTPEGNAKAVAALQDPAVEQLRIKWGLKNLPSINDYGHLEDR